MPHTSHPLIRFRPMSSREFQEWLPPMIRNYAQDKVRAGNSSEAEALPQAEQHIHELLPQGLDTADHRFWMVEDQALGHVVGSLWVRTTGTAPVRQAFLCNIEISEKYRRQGYGKATLHALEALLRDEGVSKLALHVFGFNTSAQQLYLQQGFAVTNMHMAKTL